MPLVPNIKRTVAFFDGQNLFHHARAAFGCTHPDYSPLALAHHVCKQEGFNLQEIRFYTGIPAEREEPRWNRFWSAKLLAMNHQGIVTFSRTLRYRKKVFGWGDGLEVTKWTGEEKGIDIRIALDIVRMTRKKVLDVVLLFSQDQDFSEVADIANRVGNDQPNAILGQLDTLKKQASDWQKRAELIAAREAPSPEAEVNPVTY